jgi:hypothetical protein
MGRTIIKHSSFGKVSLVLMVAVASALLAALLSTQPAKADQFDYYPLHGSGGAHVYSGGNIFARVPVNMVSWYGGLESVRWSPDLYRWNGSQWVLYDGSKPWYQASVNRYGLLTGSGQTGSPIWQNTSTRKWVPNDGGPSFYNLPRGYYMVAEHYWWMKPNVAHSQWAYFNDTNYTYATIY